MAEFTGFDPWEKLTDAEVSVDGHPFLDDDREITGWTVVGNAHDSVAIIVCDVGHPNQWDDATLDAATAFVAAAPIMFAALKRCVPENLCLTNRNVGDDTTVPLDVTMGDLRAIAAAIAKAEGR